MTGLVQERIQETLNTLQKPKDVQDPEVVDASDFQNIIALMYQESLDDGLTGNIVFYSTPENPNREHRAVAGVLQDETLGNLSVKWVTFDELRRPGVDHVILGKNEGFGFPAGFGTYTRPSKDGWGNKIVFERPARFHQGDLTRLTRVRHAIEEVEGSIGSAQLLRPKDVITPRYPG